MKICSVENCQNKVQALSLCAKHYLRKHRHGDIEYTGNRRNDKCQMQLTGGAQCKNKVLQESQYCPKHTRMMSKFGCLVADNILLSVCTHGVCTQKRNRSGLCSQHYKAKRSKNGSSQRSNLVGLSNCDKEWIHSLPCSICGWNQAPRDIHHIEPFDQKNPQYSNRLDNIIALCPNCHRLAHYSSITQQVLKESVMQILSHRANPQV